MAILKEIWLRISGMSSARAEALQAFLCVLVAGAALAACSSDDRKASQVATDTNWAPSDSAISVIIQGAEYRNITTDEMSRSARAAWLLAVDAESPSPQPSAPQSSAPQPQSLVGQTDSIEALKRRGGWPFTATDAGWIVARGEWALTHADADADRLTNSEAASVIASEQSLRYNPDIQLYMGYDSNMSPSTLDCIPWLGLDDMASTACFATNFDRLLLLRRLGRHAEADTLGISLATRLWNPAEGFFCSMLYGAPAYLPSPEPDIEAQAFALATGVLPAPQAKAAVAKWCVTSADTPLQIALAAVAAARAANGPALVKALSLLDAKAEEGSREARLYLRAALLRSVAGLSPQADGLHILPFVPLQYPDAITFDSIPYRNALLDIGIIGHGNIISTLTIDDVVTDNPILPADLSGHHTVKIRLVGTDVPDARQGIAPTPRPAPLPAPDFTLADGKVTLHCDKAKGYMQYDGSVPDMTFEGDETTLEIRPPGAIYRWAALDAGQRPGYASRAMTCLYPPADTVAIPVALLAPTGARIIKDKKLSSEFVESTRFHNRTITLDYESAIGGDYWLTVEYVSGLGIVNPLRLYALRTLSVNDGSPWLLVFPQLSPNAWSCDVEWWKRTATTIAVPIRLRPGANRVALNYYWPFDTDDDANTLLPLRFIFAKR